MLHAKLLCSSCRFMPWVWSSLLQRSIHRRLCGTYDRCGHPYLYWHCWFCAKLQILSALRWRVRCHGRWSHYLRMYNILSYLWKGSEGTRTRAWRVYVAVFKCPAAWRIGFTWCARGSMFKVKQVDVSNNTTDCRQSWRSWIGKPGRRWRSETHQRQTGRSQQEIQAPWLLYENPVPSLLLWN